MQPTNKYLVDARVAEAERAEAEAWIRRQERWEQRLAQLRRPRPLQRSRQSAHRSAA